MATRESMIKRAAAFMGSARVDDIEKPQSSRTGWLVDLYPDVYDEVLCIWPWQCARGRYRQPALAEVPAFGYPAQYDMPEKAIFVQMAQADRWVVEQRKILASTTGALNLFVTERVAPELLLPVVAGLVSLRLAHAAAMAGSESTTLQERLYTQIGEFSLQAMMVDNSQGSSTQEMASGWTLSAMTSYAPERHATGYDPDMYYLGREQELP